MKIHSIGLQYFHLTVSLNGREGKIKKKKNYFSISHDVENNGEIIITINNLVMCVMII